MQGRTEREIVLRHTNQWFTQSEWNVERFAHELLAPALVAAGLIEKALEETDGDAYLKERKAWATRLGRIFNGTSPFPLEWKWTWIGCLPARIADDVRRECIELVGGLDIRVPRISPRSPALSLPIWPGCCRNSAPSSLLRRLPMTAITRCAMTRRRST